ncbi:unnamed protein product [Schistocephalus solidus]|uniref:Uncharacterized protein n=1 Tax=Schistocephalus solidus TaxID=70667 RepID=A0A183SAT2_SCHSO|nr:unnamed protein product [Schistocephalus solidus]
MSRRRVSIKKSFYRSRRLVQQQLRGMQDIWMMRKAVEIQGFADRKAMEELLRHHQGFLRTSIKVAAPLFSANGRMLLTEKMQILTRWAEYFQSILNQPSTLSDPVIDCLPEV